MSPLYFQLILILLPVINLAEAWLEAVVIQLKDGKLGNYIRLNKQEHGRSFVYSSLVASPFLLAAGISGSWWLIAPIVINRRLIFDPALKLFRTPSRPISRYEGDGPLDGLMSSVFGRDGAHWEILAEALITGWCVYNQFH